MHLGGVNGVEPFPLGRTLMKIEKETLPTEGTPHRHRAGGGPGHRRPTTGRRDRRPPRQTCATPHPAGTRPPTGPAPAAPVISDPGVPLSGFLRRQSQPRRGEYGRHLFTQRLGVVAFSDHLTAKSSASDEPPARLRRSPSPWPSRPDSQCPTRSFPPIPGSSAAAREPSAVCCSARGMEDFGLRRSALDPDQREMTPARAAASAPAAARSAAASFRGSPVLRKA